jgi:hypothetical protein
MKVSVICLLTYLLVVSLSCKKEEQPEPETLADKLKGTVWTGEMHYDGLSLSEPYSLYFDGQGNIEWNEFNGTFGGKYTTDNASGAVQINFSSGSTVTATVTKDDQLKDFQYGGTYKWALLNGERYKTKEVELSGLWTGNPGPSFTFLSPTLVEQQTATDPILYIYNRRHGTIRFGYVPNYHFFGIVNDVSIKGINTISSGAGTKYLSWQINNF